MLSIFKKKISLNKRPFIVAEVGNNHEGNINNAIKLIDKASEAGADAVKFQTYKTNLFVSKRSKSYKRLKKFELSYEYFEKLSKHAKKRKIIFFSTPLDHASAIFLNKIQPIFKISSSDNNHKSLMELITKFEKPIFLSTGLINNAELKKIYRFLKSKIKKFKPNFSLNLLHCVSSYPVKNENANLNSIKFLQNNYTDCNIGYSDHTVGNQACVSAAILGSKIIEKHFTLNKNFSNFRDHQLSMDPKDLNEIINKIDQVISQLGKVDIIASKNELKNKNMYRRSIAAKNYIKKNSIVNEKDICFLRPGIFTNQNDLKKIIGKKSFKTLNPGDFFHLKKKRF